LNGTMWVAVGEGVDTIVHSRNGIMWTPVASSTSIFSNYGIGISWNGRMWIAVGNGENNSIAYSSDGITWTGATDSSGVVGSSKNIFRNYGNGVAGNPNVGATIVDSVITLNSNILPNTNRLDIVAANYYNTGYSNFSMEIISNS